MPYVLRNIIFIGIFWLLLLAGGLYYVNSNMAGKARKIHQDNSDKQKRLDDLESLQDNQTVLLEHLERLRSISMGEIGALVSNEKPGELFQYILDEIDMTNSEMSINLVHESEAKRQNFTSRQYAISGKASYDDIYNLIYNLENGPIFFNVTSLTIRYKEELEETDPNKSFVEYSVTVESFNRESGTEIQEISKDRFSIQQSNEIFINATSKLVEREKAKQTNQGDQGLGGSTDSPQQKSTGEPSAPTGTRQAVKTTTIQDYKILGMTPRSIIVQSPSGETEKIRIGQQINGAQLTVIDLQSGKVIFETNLNGVKQQIVLLR